MGPRVLTRILVAMAMVLTIAVPTLREGVREGVYFIPHSPFSARPTSRQLERIAQAHPQDPEIWLGYAEFGCIFGSLQRPEWPSSSDAYQHLLAIAPDSAAARFRYAMQTPDEDLKFKLLQECATLAPNNAACDYLLASIALQKGRQQDGIVYLQSALSKQDWDIYQNASTQAMLRLLDKAGIPGVLSTTEADAVGAANDFPIFSHIKELAMTVIRLGEEARAWRDHERALRHFEEVGRLGYLMRIRAYMMIEGLVGTAITSMVGDSFLSEDERAQIEQEIPDPEARTQRIHEAETRAFSAYARRMGRPDLASFFEREAGAARAWLEQCQRAVAASTEDLQVLYGGAMLHATGLWLSFAALLGVGCVVMLLSLALKHWRERRPPPIWNWVEYMVLILVLLLPAQIAGVWHAHVVEVQSAINAGSPLGLSRILSTQLGGSSWIQSATALGLTLWLIAVLILSLRKWARWTGDWRGGRVRAYLANLRVLLPPTLAAVLLLAVVSLWPVQKSWQHFETSRRAMIEQGEVSYWGIGAPDQ